jgi:hypothetical protein
MSFLRDPTSVLVRKFFGNIMFHPIFLSSFMYGTTGSFGFFRQPTFAGLFDFVLVLTKSNRFAKFIDF